MKDTVKIKTKPKVGKKARVANTSDHIQRPFFPKPKLVNPPKVTLEQAINAAWSDDMKNAKTVSLVSVKRFKPIKVRGHLFYPIVGRTATDENGNRHKVTALFVNELLRRKTPIVVDCTCGRHKFFFEAANARRGLSFLFRSNGDRPEQTNPRMKIGICKHTIRTLAWAVRNLKTLNKV